MDPQANPFRGDPIVTAGAEGLTPILSLFNPLKRSSAFESKCVAALEGAMLL